MTIHKRKRQGRNERGETRLTLKLLFISIPTSYFSLEQFYLWTFSKSSNASSVSNLLKRPSVFIHVASGYANFWNKLLNWETSLTPTSLVKDTDMPPLYCFTTPTWRTWRHMKRVYCGSIITKQLAQYCYKRIIVSWVWKSIYGQRNSKFFSRGYVPILSVFSPLRPLRVWISTPPLLLSLLCIP